MRKKGKENDTMLNGRKRIDLQFFAEGDPVVADVPNDAPEIPGQEPVGQDPTPELSGEDMIRDLFRQANENPDLLDEPDEPDEDDPADEPAPEDNPEPEPEPAEPVDPEPTPDKPIQTPEENARFAEMRRQQQEAQRQQELLQQQMQQTPEYQLAKTLENLYGVPVDQLHKQIQEAQLEQESKDKGVPIEYLKQQQTMQQQYNDLQAQLARVQFDGWYNRVNTEGTQLLDQYKMLTQDDISEAMNYSLERFGVNDMPLEQAVMALHGQKIITSLRESARQEALAEKGGRKNTALPPQSTGKAPSKGVLSEDEKAAAKALGISEEDYLKYKD
jgi:hypothetical protein